MKRAFTLIEILIVVIILGILATITTQIIYKVYQNYYISRSANKLNFESELILNKIAAKLQLRVPNSTIAVKCTLNDNGCANGNVLGFKAVSTINSATASQYPVLEWLQKDIYSKRGEFNDTLKRVIPGWAGFVDLVNTVDYGNDRYQITLPYSNFDIVKEIDSNWSAAWGINGNIFQNRYEVLIFSGADSRGDFTDINNSYGYYGNKAYNVFKINSYSVSITANNTPKTVATVEAIDKSNKTNVYEQFFLINTAVAIVPVKDFNSNDYNLTLRFNYFPWNDQNYTDGNSTVLATHITQFRFKEQNGVMRIYICVSDPKIEVEVKGKKEKLSVCKEKVVF
jgi:prepilin-type N-terminal cleavage/methylation domain-containing protein